MAEGLHEEGIIPAGTLDFEADGLAVGVGSQDVKGQPAQNGEVLWSIVLSRTVGVLGKMDVEHPMKPVLDTPMTAGDVQQPLWGDVFGQEVVAHDRSIGVLAPQAPSRGDPAHRSDAWKAVEGSQAGIAMMVPRRASRRSWVERSVCSATLRLPDRANCCVTAVNSRPRFALIAR